jgi:menaquinone-dependent protoporphyrinogen oxidase
MKTIALIYSSKYGQTRKIATFMRDCLIAKGHSVHLRCADETRSSPELSSQTDLVIVGAPVYREKFSKNILRWVRQHKSELTKIKSAFFSVGLNAADSRMGCRLADKRIHARFIAKTHWLPTYLASFAGAIKYKEYNWFLRHIMRRISAAAGGPVDIIKNHELTDWKVVESFLNDIINERQNSPFSTTNVLPQT